MENKEYGGNEVIKKNQNVGNSEFYLWCLNVGRKGTNC